MNGAELVRHGMSYGPIFGKVRRMTRNDLDMFKVKNTNRHATNTLKPKCSSVALYDDPFLSYGPIIWKSAPNDPK